MTVVDAQTTANPRVNHRGVDLDVLDAMREFVTTQIRPQVAAYETAGEFPQNIWDDLAGRGLLIPFLPTEYGGHGVNKATFAASHEILGAPDQNGRSKATAQAMVGEGIHTFGTPEQIERYLLAVASGLPAGFCLSGAEPGSVADVSGTQAIPTPTGYLLRGGKMWTTNARDGQLFMVFAQTGSDPEQQTVFLVPRDAEGVRIQPLYTSGIRANGLGSVHFDNVELGADAIVGIEHEAQLVRNHCLTEVGRPSVAAGAAGLIGEVLTICRDFTKRRTIAGLGPLAQQPGIRQKLGEMVEWWNAACLCYEDAARRCDAGQPEWMTFSWMAKDIAAGHAVLAATMGTIMLGARSMLHPADDVDELAVLGARMDRQFRDARALELIEGTAYVTREVIADDFLNGAFDRARFC